jgi:hypothetical protein
MHGLRLGLFGLFAAALVGGGVVAKRTFLPAGETAPGLRVDGTTLSEPLRDFVAKRKQAIENKGRVNVPLVYRFDGERVISRFETLKEREDTSPESARLDLDRRTVVGEKDGRYLDVWGAAAHVEMLARNGGDTVIIPVVRVKPRISAEYVRSLDISNVIGEYETYFSRAEPARLRLRSTPRCCSPGSTSSNACRTRARAHTSRWDSTRRWSIRP